MSFSVPLTSFFNDVKICVTSYFIYGVSHEGNPLYFQWNNSEKSLNISWKLISLSIGVTKVNFVWCVFHSAQWYWSDNLCKLVTDQWQGYLGVRDRESCWLTEEIGTYMRCWENPGDLPPVISILSSQNFYHSWKITRSFPRTYVKTYYSWLFCLLFIIMQLLYLIWYILTQRPGWLNELGHWI